MLTFNDSIQPYCRPTNKKKLHQLNITFVFHLFITEVRVFFILVCHILLQSRMEAQLKGLFELHHLLYMYSFFNISLSLRNIHFTFGVKGEKKEKETEMELNITFHKKQFCNALLLKVTFLNSLATPNYLYFFSLSWDKACIVGKKQKPSTMEGCK